MRGPPVSNRKKPPEPDPTLMAREEIEDELGKLHAVAVSPHRLFEPPSNAGLIRRLRQLKIELGRR